MSAAPVIIALPRRARRRLRADGTWRRWTTAWLGGSVLGIVNGTLREVAYKDRVGELTADQLSGATLIGLLALYFWLLDRLWPIPTRRAALAIGGTWVVLTVAFEFLFGHWVDGDSWSELAGNYNLAEGNLWLLVLAWIGAGPAVIRRLRRGEGGTR
jgi:hypothetical protein